MIDPRTTARPEVREAPDRREARDHREAHDLDEARTRLQSLLLDLGEVAVALSGGVDSLTLAAFALETLQARARWVHAVSPAVPRDATVRVKAFAAERGAALTVLDAGEFADEAYRRNPLDRCYFCKSHLYDAIRSRLDCVVVSGTNLDDLSDFRPGLRAALERGVRHPLAEAGFTKARVREMARSLGLGDIAELPASPCLSSRVETGIRIETGPLALIDSIETELRQVLGALTVRCRIRRRGLVVELDRASLASLPPEDLRMWGDRIAGRAAAAGLRAAVEFEVYQQGSAFLHPA